MREMSECPRLGEKSIFNNANCGIHQNIRYFRKNAFYIPGPNNGVPLPPPRRKIKIMATCLLHVAYYSYRLGPTQQRIRASALTMAEMTHPVFSQ